MKVNLTEKEIREIARQVILKNELILEKPQVSGTPAPDLNPDSAEAAEKAEKSKEPVIKKEKKKEKKKTKYEDLVKSGNTDNLAVETSGIGGRSQDIVSGAATAGGVTLGALTLFNMGSAGLGAAGAAALGGSSAIAASGAGLSAAILGTGAASVAAAETLGAVALGVASGPVGWGALAVAGGAGLYYLFTPETTSSDALKEALDTTLYKRVAAGFTKVYDQLRNSELPEIREIADKMNPKKCLDVPNSNEAAKLAQDIYDATQGGMLGLGLGTNKAGIEKALKKCKSFLGVSRVSFKHAKMFEGVIDDGDLLKVLTGELNNADMENHVNSVIDGLPYIIVNEKEYSKEEFQQWLVESKELTDKMLSEIKDAAEEAESDPEVGGSETEDLQTPYVQQIQRLINEYCSQKGIDYTPLTEDNKWGPKTTALWKNKYLPHVLANHPVFSTLGVKIGDGKWLGISSQLSERYPGYTSGQKGCARFCIDALYGNTIKGEETDKSDSNIKYFGGRSGSKKVNRKKSTGNRDKGEAAEKRSDVIEKKRNYVPSDGRLSYKNIKIDIDVVGDRSIRKLAQLRGAAADADDELKYDFLTNFGTGRLDLPVGETFQIHVQPKKDGKIKLQHKSTKLFKARGIRTFAEPFHRFFKGLNMSDTEIKRLKIDKSSPIIIKVIMPPGLYNPAVER